MKHFDASIQAAETKLHKHLTSTRGQAARGLYQQVDKNNGKAMETMKTGA